MKIRIRRGKEVVIPEKWVGNFTTPKTIRDRKGARVEARATKKRRLRVESRFHWKSQVEE